MEDIERVGMPQTKTESSTTLPEQMNDKNGVSSQSVSSSTEAEPSTSNKASFKDNEAERYDNGRPVFHHLTDLICVGSGFDKPQNESSDIHDQVDHSLRRNRSFRPEQENISGGERNDTIEGEVMKSDENSVTEDVSGTVDTDDKTIGHALGAWTEAKQSDRR